MKHWKTVTIESIYDVLNKKEIDYVKSNIEEIFEQNNCHHNAFYMVIELAYRFGTKIEFCEGCFHTEPNPAFMHCWNRVYRGGKWHHIDIGEIGLSTEVKGDTYCLYETWERDNIVNIFTKERTFFVPFYGCGDWGSKFNHYYVKENGKPIRMREENNWTLAYKRYGIEVCFEKIG